ncbi:hypothetical protein EVAR_71047_1 [Eumeta japonica]|uniref:Uncharacterized protein n=1 Tax=Eumeta variegata TaxID=151549 RepID=A0A4C1T2P9_EUMVA|nr:hypothetical protein EVAR_71047_1 [Eumeta japonica]
MVEVKTGWAYENSQSIATHLEPIIGLYDSSSWPEKEVRNHDSIHEGMVPVASLDTSFRRVSTDGADWIHVKWPDSCGSHNEKQTMPLVERIYPGARIGRGETVFICKCPALAIRRRDFSKHTYSLTWVNLSVKDRDLLKYLTKQVGSDAKAVDTTVATIDEWSGSCQTESFRLYLIVRAERTTRRTNQRQCTHFRYSVKANNLFATKTSFNSLTCLNT